MRWFNLHYLHNLNPIILKSIWEISETKNSNLQAILENLLLNVIVIFMNLKSVRNKNSSLGRIKTIKSCISNKSIKILFGNAITKNFVIKINNYGIYKLLISTSETFYVIIISRNRSLSKTSKGVLVNKHPKTKVSKGVLKRKIFYQRKILYRISLVSKGVGNDFSKKLLILNLKKIQILILVKRIKI